MLPNTIGAILFIGYFILKDKLTDKAELESCERFYISNAVYLIFVSVIVLLSSLYQTIIGNRILKKNENNFALNIVNSVTFGIFFTLILIIVEFVNKDVIEVEFFGEIFLSMLFLALLNFAFKKFCGKLFGNKFAN